MSASDASRGDGVAPDAAREHAREDALEDELSTPDDAVVAALAATRGDLCIVGAGGKMGPTLARMARRALDAADVPRTGAGARRVVAVARFGDARARAMLEAAGVETHAADVADRAQADALPDAGAVWHLVGQKFGTRDDPVATWTHNVVAAVHVAERFRGVPTVVFSTGNVYPRSPVAGGGLTEDAPLAADGEYAATAIGRERVFGGASVRHGTPVLLFRLCYACDLRYGVLTDLAVRLRDGRPVDLATGHANVIWQRDANALALRAIALATSPARALNVSGPPVALRPVAQALAARFGVQPAWGTSESADALLVNVDACARLLPGPRLPLDTLVTRTADWVRAGGRLLAKPTHFDVRDGRY